MKKHKILIVEDHKELAENLFEYLGEQKYELDYAADGLTALHLVATNSFDLIILDIMLPGIDGLTLCKRIRQDLHSSVPIIMLTARDSIEDKAAAFNNLADDYLVKPFNMRELELRIQAMSRRSQTTHDCIQAENTKYFPGTLTIRLNDKLDIQLSGYNATIFHALIQNYPNFVRYEDLSNSLWGTSDGDPKTIRTHIYVLRKALKDASQHDFIKTLHGRGYSLCPL